jgi:hypothetical protein
MKIFKRILLLLNILTIAVLNAMEQRNRIVVTYKNNNMQPHPPRPQLAWNDAKFLSHECLRSKVNQQSSLQFALAIHDSMMQNQVNYTYGICGITIAEQINDVPALKPFIELYQAQPQSHIYKNNQQTINRLLPILYLANGYPKLELNPYEKYQVARVITDYFKAIQPNEYLKFVNHFASQGHPEFQQVLKEETTYGSWLKYETVKCWGLLKGLFAATAFNGDINTFRKTLENNVFLKNFSQVDSITLKGDFV